MDRKSLSTVMFHISLVLTDTCVVNFAQRSLILCRKYVDLVLLRLAESRQLFGWPIEIR